MTIEGIIRMAKQAGFADEEIDVCQQILINFATLVASAERRNCVDTLCAAGVASKDDDLEWAEVAFWCCSRINNPEPTDKTLAVNYKQTSDIES